MNRPGRRYTATSPLADEHLEWEVDLDSDFEVMRYLSGRARELVRYGFDDVGLDRIIAQTMAARRTGLPGTAAFHWRTRRREAAFCLQMACWHGCPACAALLWHALDVTALLERLR